MVQSSGSLRPRKPASKPKKPYPEYPLTPHAGGKWMKKIGGSIYYFGNWGRRVDGKLQRVPGDGWEEALELYRSQVDNIRAGQPRTNTGGITVADLCNHFLTAKLRKQEARELGVRSFADYKQVTDLIISMFGSGRAVESLAPKDFAALRAKMAKNWGPVRLGNAVTRTKSVFKFGTDNGLIKTVVSFGSEFIKPDKSVLRRHRAKSGDKMFTPEEIRNLVDGAGHPLRAMILLGVNAGFGNNDCATLPLAAINLDSGWLNYARPKTGIQRSVPLWPETIEAIRKAIATRTKPARDAFEDIAFLTGTGHAFINTTEKSHKDQITIQFNKLLKSKGMVRQGASFYSLRHVFRTIADATRDPVAIDLIMGHTDPSMGAAYRERVDGSRLKVVTDHVRKWLFIESQTDRPRES